MKNLLLPVLCLGLTIGPLNASEIYNVKSAQCDGVAQELSEELGVHISLRDFKVAFISRDGDCEINEGISYSVNLFGGNTYEEGNKNVAFDHKENLGRFSSCEEGIQEYAGPSFESGVYSEKEGKASITFKNMNGCESLTYELSNLENTIN